MLVNKLRADCCVTLVRALVEDDEAVAVAVLVLLPLLVALSIAVEDG